jgi:hypothetical protein
MKKFLLSLMVFLTISSSSLAGESYFGVGLRTFVTTPLLWAQLGYDFETKNNGFGIRAGVSSILLVNDAGVDAYYRVPLDSDGMAFHGGLGVGGFLALSPAASGFQFWHLHAVIGLSRVAGPDSAWTLEVLPGVGLNGSGLVPYLAFAFGFNFYFQ